MVESAHASLFSMWDLKDNTKGFSFIDLDFKMYLTFKVEMCKAREILVAMYSSHDLPHMWNVKNYPQQ